MKEEDKSREEMNWFRIFRRDSLLENTSFGEKQKIVTKKCDNCIVIVFVRFELVDGSENEKFLREYKAWSNHT